MDFELTSNQKMIKQMVSEFAEKELLPAVEEMDKRAEFPLSQMNKLAKLGLLGLSVPEAAGGYGLDSLCMILAVEELSKVWASVGLVVSNHNLGCLYPIYKFGTDEQKRRYLKPLIQGEKLGTIALLEPGDSSDPFVMKTRAEKANGGYILDGIKTLVVAANNAQLFLVVAILNGSPAYFLLEKDAIKDNISISPNLLGMKSAGCGQISFNNFHLPGSARLALTPSQEPFNVIDFYNLGLSAISLGLLQICYDSTVAFSKERHQFGHPICTFPMVQEKLIKIAAHIAAARALVYQTIIQLDHQKANKKNMVLCKYLSSQQAIEGAIDAVQIYGGDGYTTDYPIERYLRDAQLLSLLGGTPFYQMNLIAQEILR